MPTVLADLGRHWRRTWLRWDRLERRVGRL